ncbi:Flp pilus assembly protein, pilin Flp [Caulobacter vibrioides OR37]|jgi:Flp pilus assembly pilin Flp|uniref:Flp pilus assembly protein, pilin Flp n=1 Tax=Caulobacter vibrioides OR37 TaxID=1292034 RepID=R0EEZ6_CAUVI|nr:Flp pilus assembly protein, pilin Flp [Caulobacter vibrioides OR37]
MSRAVFWRDEKGVASVEATILLAVLGMALLAGGYRLGPAIKAYSDRLSAAVREARCLAAGDPSAPPPPCQVGV